MERIRKALEKARQERAQRRGTAVDTAPARPGVPGAEPPIRYSSTRVVTLDPGVLQRQRVLLADDHSPESAAFKMLRTQVVQRMVAQNWNVLAVTSPAPGDGKTLVAVNLAISLARQLHHTVLLVDLDLRRPSVHGCLGIDPTHGIDDYLLYGTPLEDILINPGVERLVVLPGKGVISNSSEILASPAMAALVQELRTRYPSRFVIFDLPPIISADDALSFSPYIDALLLVVRDGRTTREELQQAMEILKDSTILGTVLNASSDKISAYY